MKIFPKVTTKHINKNPPESNASYAKPQLARVNHTIQLNNIPYGVRVVKDFVLDLAEVGSMLKIHQFLRSLR